MLEKEPPIVELSQRISKRIASSGGTYAVAFADLKTGDTLYINAHERFHAATTIDTPVMIELYKQAAAGKFSLDDSILVKNEFVSIVDGSSYTMEISLKTEPALYDKIGKMIPIRELLFEMMSQSSNLATNILIELVEAKSVTASMRSLGAPDIEILRGAEDTKAYEQGLSNTTTAFDLMKIYEAIGTDLIIGESECKEMIDLLQVQEFNEVIPAKLPKDVKIAHKTGWITGIQHDSGIIILPNGHEYVLVLLSRELPSREEGLTLLADVSKMIYDYVVADKHKR